MKTQLFHLLLLLVKILDSFAQNAMIKARINDSVLIPIFNYTHDKQVLLSYSQNRENGFKTILFVSDGVGTVYYFAKIHNFLFNKKSASLLIPKVSWEFDGFYQQVYSNNKQFLTRLLVVANGSSPQIAFEPKTSIKSGQQLTISCNTSGANPPVELQWRIQLRNGSWLLAFPDSAINSESEGIFSTTRSSLKLNVTPMHHRALVQCQFLQPFSNVTVNANANLLVMHKPIVKAEKNVSVIEGQIFTVHCSATGYPEPKIHFANANGTIISENFKAGKVEIRGLRRDESGMYNCIGSNSVGATSQALHIRVQYAPSVQVPDLVTVQSGQNLRVKCNVSSDPGPSSLKWTHKSKVYSASTDSDGWLNVGNVSPDLAGSWKCEAKAKLRAADGSLSEFSSSAIVQVVVQYRPSQPAISTHHRIVQHGQSLNVSCGQNPLHPGEPAPRFLWQKRVAASNQLTNVSSVLTTNRNELLLLVIDSVQLDHDGEYVCVAMNNLGMSLPTSLRVVVQQQPIIDVTQFKDKVIVREGVTDLTLHCAASAKPQPQFHWWRFGANLNSNLKSYTHAFFASDSSDTYYKSSLKLNGNSGKIQMSDTGPFTCEAVNEFGSDNRTVILEVQCAPRITNKFDKMAKISGNQLTCDFVSHAEFEIIWKSLETGESLNGDASLINESVPYLLRSHSPFNTIGNYSCAIHNSLGKAEKRFQIIIESIPTSPQSLHAVNVTWHSMKLIWMAGFDGGHKTDLLIQIRGWNASALAFTLQTIRTPAADEAVTVNALFPNTNYHITAQAVNALGSAVSNVTLKVVTDHLHLPSIKQPHWSHSEGTFSFVGSEGHCAKLEISLDSGVSWHNLHSCHAYHSSGHKLNLRSLSLQLRSNQQQQQEQQLMYRVSLCLQYRQDVCGQPYTTYNIGTYASVSIETILIVGGVCTALIMLLVSILLCFCLRRCCCFSDLKRQQPADESDARVHRELQNRNKPSSRSSNSSTNSSCQLKPSKTLMSYVMPNSIDNWPSGLHRSNEVYFENGSAGSGMNIMHPSTSFCSSANATAAAAAAAATVASTVSNHHHSHNNLQQQQQQQQQYYEESDMTDLSGDTPPILSTAAFKEKKVIYEVVV